MKDILYLDKKEQLELIGDPFVHDILDIMNYDIVSREWIIEKLDENPNMINDYLDRLLENNIITKEEDNKVRVTAKSIEGKEIVYKNLKEDDLHWLNGYINHLENRIVDLYRYLGKLDDPEAKLEELNYTPDLYASSNKVYLTKEEADELTKMISDFLRQDREELRKKSENNDKYNLYEFYGYLFPELKDFKEKIEEK
ncbi:MAG: hypothetical protein U5K53_00445 [Halanaerobiales bacterium]|nr:hypothetical protein [Halanaerobiales bacterium]